MALGGLIVVFLQVPQLAALVADHPPAVTTWTFYRDALLLSTVLFFGSMLLGLLVMVTVPRLLRLLVRPDREYRLYGMRYWAHRTIARMTNCSSSPGSTGTAPTSCTTCAASGTTCRRSSRPARTSGRRSSTTTRS